MNPDRMWGVLLYVVADEVERELRWASWLWMRPVRRDEAFRYGALCMARP